MNQIDKMMYGLLRYSLSFIDSRKNNVGVSLEQKDGEFTFTVCIVYPDKKFTGKSIRDALEIAYGALEDEMQRDLSRLISTNDEIVKIDALPQDEHFESEAMKVIGRAMSAYVGKPCGAYFYLNNDGFSSCGWNGGDLVATTSEGILRKYGDNMRVKFLNELASVRERITILREHRG